MSLGSNGHNLLDTICWTQELPNHSPAERGLSNSQSQTQKPDAEAGADRGKRGRQRSRNRGGPWRHLSLGHFDRHGEVRRGLVPTCPSRVAQCDAIGNGYSTRAVETGLRSDRSSGRGVRCPAA